MRREGSWRLKETSCHSDSRERSSAQKKSTVMIMIIIITPNLSLKTRSSDSQQKKKEANLSADHRVKYKAKREIII